MASLWFLFCLGLPWTLIGSAYQVNVYVSLNGGGHLKSAIPKCALLARFQMALLTGRAHREWL